MFLQSRTSSGLCLEFRSSPKAKRISPQPISKTKHKSSVWNNNTLQRVCAWPLDVHMEVFFDLKVLYQQNSVGVWKKKCSLFDNALVLCSVIMPQTKFRSKLFIKLIETLQGNSEDQTDSVRGWGKQCGCRHGYSNNHGLQSRFKDTHVDWF